jgi:predicted acylesterase/phospholipase RssA
VAGTDGPSPEDALPANSRAFGSIRRQAPSCASAYTPRASSNPSPSTPKARELFERFQPRVPFALTTVELPSLRSHIVRDREVTWQHLAACCAIPFAYPPVEIAGRRYVDGGLRAGLPLWAADELGATQALALNVLNTPGFRLLHRVMRGKRAGASLQVVRVEPSRRLGSLRDAVCWSDDNIERWIAQGEQDAKCLASSITM